MRSATAIHPVDSAVRHIVSTLPDSLSDRLRVLKITLHGVPADYPHSDWLRTLISDCREAEQHQLKFLELLNNGGAK